MSKFNYMLPLAKKAFGLPLQLYLHIKDTCIKKANYLYFNCEPNKMLKEKIFCMRNC